MSQIYLVLSYVAVIFFRSQRDLFTLETKSRNFIPLKIKAKNIISLEEFVCANLQEPCTQREYTVLKNWRDRVFITCLLL